MMKIAVSEDGKMIDASRLIPTPKDFTNGLQTIIQIGKELSGGKRFRGVCGGVPGLLTKEKEILLVSSHLPRWAGRPILKELERAFGTSVMLENDTALAGLGEAVVGAGRGKGIVAYLTVSTGVGGVRIVRGKIDVHRLGFEPGHQIIDIGSAGKPVTLEECISGSALADRLGIEPGKVINPAVWDELARILAYGVNNTVLHWAPDIVILGGSMITKRVGIKVSEVERYLKQALTIIPLAEQPPVVEAELGDQGGLHGALALLRRGDKLGGKV